MRTAGHATFYRPRFTIGSSQSASMPVKAHARGCRKTSFKRRAKTDPGLIAFAIKSWPRFYRRLVGFLFLLALAHAHALDPSRRIAQYGHTAWRTGDGLVPAESN